MIELNNLKEKLTDLYELSEETNFKVDGKPAKIADVQELYKEKIIDLLDSIGLEDIYLN
ncbi:hypothetical protein RG601_04905 [Enterococcus sp. FR169]|uniref:hypothetical protein n=1 Tax=Enterococcus sp. FR169 TaxID=2923505 RepID=UPI00280E583B|nr:hypothetical protein [Enterococcus sp. FR169]MDQ8644375.1 hypothetical protein [Enterococcus sp. FR169]